LDEVSVLAQPQRKLWVSNWLNSLDEVSVLAQPQRKLWVSNWLSVPILFPARMLLLDIDCLRINQ